MAWEEDLKEEFGEPRAKPQPIPIKAVKNTNPFSKFTFPLALIAILTCSIIFGVLNARMVWKKCESLYTAVMMVHQETENNAQAISNLRSDVKTLYTRTWLLAIANNNNTHTSEYKKGNWIYFSQDWKLNQYPANVDAGEHKEELERHISYWK